MKKLYFLSLFFALCFKGAFSMDTWVRVYSQTYYDQAYSVVQTWDKGYIVGGTIQWKDYRSTDWWILKLNSQGEKEWERVYGGDKPQLLSLLVATEDGKYIGGGSAWHTNLGGYVPLLVKFDKDGTPLWEKTYALWADYNCVRVQPTRDGGFIVVLYPLTRAGTDIVVKMDEKGEILWYHKAFRVGDISEASDGSYIEVTHDGNGIQVNRLDSQGNMKWQKSFSVKGKSMKVLIGEEDVSQIIVSVSDQFLWMVTLFKDGNILNTLTTDRLKINGIIHEVKRLSKGGWLMVGETRGEDTDVWIARFDEKGHLLWEKLYRTSYTDSGNDVCEGIDGGYVVVGTCCIWHTMPTGGGFFIMKIDENGNTEDKEKWWEFVGGY